MTVITNWKAVRSGPGMTIDGQKSDTGAPIKLTNINSVEFGDGKIIAKDKNGYSYELAKE